MFQRTDSHWKCKCFLKTEMLWVLTLHFSTYYTLSCFIFLTVWLSWSGTSRSLDSRFLKQIWPVCVLWNFFLVYLVEGLALPIFFVCLYQWGSQCGHSPSQLQGWGIVYFCFSFFPWTLALPFFTALVALRAFNNFFFCLFLFSVGELIGVT